MSSPEAGLAETSRRYFVCKRHEIRAGDVRPAKVAGRAMVVVCDAADSLYALRDICPHQRASLSAGSLVDLVTGNAPNQFRIERPCTILRCPRHGYEFDVRSGKSVVSPDTLRVRAYEVVVEDGEVFVVVG